MIEGSKRSGAFLFLLVLLWAAIWWMDRYSLGLQFSAYLWSVGAVGNALPFATLFVLLLLLTNRLYLSFFLALATGALLYFISFKKYQSLGKPLSGDDFLLLQYLDSSALELFASYVKLRWVVLAGGLGVFFIALMAYLDNPFFQRKSIARKCSVGLLIISLSGIWYFKGIETIYEFNRMRFSWSNPISTLHAGLVSKIIYGEIKKSQSNDMPISAAEINNVLQKNNSCMKVSASASSSLAVVPPDIIVIQSESFFDPDILQGVELPNNLLRNLRQLKTAGAVGQMKVPTFGGGTIRTEYEVLTGIDLAAYPLVQFPYFEVRTPKMDSLASEVKENGYEAIAIHGNAGSFWNRTKTFKLAGFDRFLTVDDFPSDAEHDGAYLSDKSMTDLVIAQLSKADHPKFIFAISIEAHGPYTIGSIKDAAVRDAIPVPSGLSAEGAEEYRNYIYHIDNADQQLGRLKNYLDARGKPYVLVFYGDHLPGLGGVYETFGFKNGAAATDQTFPWIITRTSSTNTSSIDTSWKLGPALLKEAGLSVSPYFHLVNCLEAVSEVTGTEPGFYSVARAQTQGRLGDYVSAGEKQ